MTKTTKKFKHSGATGDLLYSLAITKHMGGGEFYLHLNQMDWIGQHYYGALPTPFHQGRMTQSDFDYMRDFMLAQEYITLFDTVGSQTEITHNLDRFRPLFVGHPTNYLDIYATAFGLSTQERAKMNSQPWLSVPQPTKIPGKTIVINRTQRWIPSAPSSAWAELRPQVETQAVFVGLPQEYDAFKLSTGWDQIIYYPTHTQLDLAKVIAGAECFIGNQSQAYALAVGLGVEEILCEVREDLPLERNECFFPQMENIRYI
jgi:hypothetical protein